MLHTEEKIIYGKIYTQGLAFEMLELEPQKRLRDLLPYRLREHVQVFLVIDTDNKAFPLYVSTWSGYAIVPSTPELRAVQFELEEEDNSVNISSEQTSVVE